MNLLYAAKAAVCLSMSLGSAYLSFIGNKSLKMKWVDEVIQKPKKDKKQIT